MDDKAVIERLEKYAMAIARNLLFKYDLEHDKSLQEDIAQRLFLAGHLNWDKTHDEGLAKHRMSTRRVDEERKLSRDLKQPRPVSSLALPTRKHREDVDSTEKYHTESADMPGRRFHVGHTARASPLEDLEVQEFLDSLPERTRVIVQCRMANMSLPEIATQLGVSTKTIERELEQLRKGLE